jgi:hypothetical protein
VQTQHVAAAGVGLGQQRDGEGLEG